MTEAQTTELLRAFNEFMEQSGSNLRLSWADAEFIVQAAEEAAESPATDH